MLHENEAYRKQEKTAISKNVSLSGKVSFFYRQSEQFWATTERTLGDKLGNI